jgi:peptidoglycan/LPS O-acetylase OafA/YrhL
MTSKAGPLAHPTYRPDIDGLRAIAVLSVLLFHAYPEYIHGGFIGVDIFFVISGFLISSIIFGGLETDTFSFIEFYARRVKRIFPALALVLAASFAAGSVILYGDEFKPFGKHIAAGVGFVSNLILWQESGYFDASADTKPLLHLWSLGIEEQFYIFWPLLAWLGWRRKIGLLAVTLVILAASFALNIRKSPYDEVYAFYSPQTRFWELLCGAVLAWVAMHKTDLLERLRQRFGTLLSALGFLLFAAGLVFINKDSRFPGWWAIMPVAGAVLIIAAGAGSRLNAWLLSNRVAVWFGLISYPLYLWHWPLLSYCFIAKGGTPTLAVRTAAVVLAIALAWLTYQFIEKPVRQKKFGPYITPILVSVMLIIGLSGVKAYLDGQAVSPKVAAKATKAAPPSNPRVMLLGDSHAEHLYPGLRNAFGGDVANYTLRGCIPFYDVDRYDSRFAPGICSAAMNKALKHFEEDSRLNTIILSSMGPVYLTGETFKGMDPARVTGLVVTLDTDKRIKDRWQVYETGMRNTLRKLVATKKHVIFVIDVPELGVEPINCRPGIHVPVFGSSYLIRGGQACVVSRKEYDDRALKYRTMVTRIAKEFPEVDLFDPTALFCDDQLCHGVKDGKMLYRDVDHLSDDGADYVVSHLAGIIRARLE